MTMMNNVMNYHLLKKEIYIYFKYFQKLIDKQVEECQIKMLDQEKTLKTMNYFQ